MARSRGPGTAGWHSIAIFPKNAKEFYGQIVLVGYTGQPFSSFSSPFTNAVHQRRSGWYQATAQPAGPGLLRENARGPGAAQHPATDRDVWEESNELNFVVVGPAGDVQFLPTSADFIRHFPHMSAVGARQHPQPAFSGREEFESGFNAAACDGCP